jgi:hypothetical protein
MAPSTSGPEILLNRIWEGAYNNAINVATFGASVACRIFEDRPLHRTAGRRLIEAKEGVGHWAEIARGLRAFDKKDPDPLGIDLSEVNTSIGQGVAVVTKEAGGTQENYCQIS